MLQGYANPESNLPDDALATRAARGVRAAFAELVVRHQDRIYRLAIRMCHNAADAEEIAQETFILAHRGIAAFHGDARFSTWLYRIAVNQVLMRRRAARRRPAQPFGLWADDSNLELASSDLLPDSGTDDLVDRKNVALRVREALAQLDEPSRAALVLRDLEELSAEEAADILGVSADTVRQRAHRARLKLRRALGDLVATPPSAVA